MLVISWSRSPWERAILREEGRPIVKYRGAKTAELIEMLFGLGLAQGSMY